MFEYIPRYARYAWLTRSAVPFLLLLPLFWIGSNELSAQNTDSIRAEAYISETKPFVQQTLIYTVRVYHGSGVSELNCEVLLGPEFSIEQLAGPPKTTRWLARGKQTSDFIYALTPIAEGSKEIQAAHIKATTDNIPHSGWSSTYIPTQPLEASTRPIQLDVQSAANITPPWLPLYEHQVTVQFDQDQHAKVGEPLKVTVVQNAWGVKGDRLPNLASQLKSEDFTVYAEKSNTSWRLVQNRQILVAQRIEPLTLIPLRQGPLNIPPLKVSWWNVSQHRKVWTEWPGASVEIQPTAETNPSQVADEGRISELRRLWIWIFVTALVSFVAGWWLGHGDVEWKRWKHVPNPLTALGDRFRPHQWLALRSIVRGSRWLRSHLVQVHPVWLEVMLLRSHIRSANDAHALEHELQAFAHHTLGLSENLSIQGVANKMATAYPNLDESRLRALLGRLDAALYGNEQPFMIDDWKRDFEQVLHKLSFRSPRKTAKSINDELPELNPGHPGFGGNQVPRTRKAHQESVRFQDSP